MFVLRFVCRKFKFLAKLLKQFVIFFMKILSEIETLLFREKLLLEVFKFAIIFALSWQCEPAGLSWRNGSRFCFVCRVIAHRQRTLKNKFFEIVLQERVFKGLVNNRV
jgi:hypothetical protein